MNIKTFLLILCLVFFLAYPVAADANDTFAITAQVAVPTVTTNDSTNVEETTATLNGFLVDDAGAACQYRFQYDIDAGVPYASSTVWAGAINTGQTFSYGVSSLTKGELYFFRAQCQNVNGINSGGEKTFLTKPDGPTNFQAVRNGALLQIDLTWTKGDGGYRTHIVRKIGSNPTDYLDGVVVYNGTSNSYEDGAIVAGSHYFYRAWMYCSDGGLYRYSDESDEDNIIALAPATFDIRDILIIDDVIPDLEISVVVENRGGILVDITVSWVLKRTDNSNVLDMGSDTFAVAPFSEEIYTINPTTTYEGSVIITFSGDGASASGMFTTKTPTPGPPGGGGPPPYRPPPVVPEPPVPAPAAAAVPSWLIILIFVVAVGFVFFIIWLKRKEEEEEEKSTSKPKHTIRQMFRNWWNSME